MAGSRQRGRPKAFNDKTEQNTIQTLDRALILMRTVSEHDGITLSELAEETGQSAATVYRVLTTMAAHKMLEIDEESQLWYVGAGAFRAGSAFLRRSNVVERSRAAMHALMRDTGETANLGLAEDGQVIFISQVETHETIRAFFPPGTKSPMHASGIGKALLAHYPRERVEQIAETEGLERFTDRTNSNLDDLMNDLERVRRRGYAIDNEEKATGMRCIAAAIFNTHGEAIAGISVSGPGFRIPGPKQSEFGERVRAAADTVTEAIGGRYPSPD